MAEAPARKKPVHVKLDAQIVKEVDLLSVERDEYRPQTMEYLLRRGLDVATQGSGGGRQEAQQV